MQQIQLNIIPFKPVVDNQTFAFYGEKQKGFAPIYWDKLFESFPEGREAKHKNYYSDFQPARQGAIEKEHSFYRSHWLFHSLLPLHHPALFQNHGRGYCISQLYRRCGSVAGRYRSAARSIQAVQ